MQHHVKDLSWADAGKNKVEWADHHMPVLRAIRERFSAEKPLKGVRIAACLHVTSETANLVRTLAAGGAEVFLCASNPLSTQDDVAAAIAKHYGVATFAVRGEDRDTYYKHIDAVLDARPQITVDDGADLVSRVHQERKDVLPGIAGGMEETTTGVIRLRAMERDGALKYPILAVNDAATKHLFDNRYGTGQSTVDGIIRATNLLFAGHTVVAVGYGWCGRGFAARARGMGARVLVCEVDPIRALEAALDGFEVVPMAKAAPIGDVFCTLTGNTSVVRREHFLAMKDGAVVCNSGHFNVECDLEDLAAESRTIQRQARPGVDRYELKSGRSIFVLGEGRLVNLACAEGHPASVMDMSFATQATGAEYVLQNRGKLPPRVIPFPREIENWIATVKLKTLGFEIDKLTPKQEMYLTTWNEGT